MDEIVDSEQLAELESLLYSQIHYSVDTQPSLPPAEMSSESPKNNQNVYDRPRYFGRNPPATHPKEKEIVTQVLNTDIIPLTQNQMVSQNPPNEMPAVHIHQPIQFKMPQFYQQPVNNIVFMPPNIPPMNSVQVNNAARNQRRKINKQLKKSHEMTVQQAIHDAEVFRHLNQEDRSRVLKIQKRQRYLARKRERKKLLKEQEAIEKFNASIKDKTATKPAEKPLIVNEIIELSESEDDEIVAVEEKIETVVVSSDEEDKPPKIEIPTPTPSIVTEGDDGSVQFVETPVAEPIVLDIEPEIVAGPSKTDAEMMKPPSDPETNSLASSASALSTDKHDMNAPITPKSLRLRQSRQKELLNTPESSNDFLDTTLDVSQQNFNFSLHGKDLCVEKNILNPRVLADACESESSCSTSDISSMKHPVFHEIEFESPAKQLFSEVDLDSFSEYITPKRKALNTSALTSNIASPEGPDEAEPSKQLSAKNTSDSESSSESELEDEGVNVRPVVPKRKRLPSLSHFDVLETPAQSTPVAKTKNKKIVKAANKFDFIKDFVEEQTKQDVVVEPETPKEKKRKKRKRKNANGKEKADTAQTENTEVDDEVDPKLGSKKKRKRQKSKSDTEIEKPSTNTPQRGSKKRVSTKSDSEIDDIHENDKRSKKRTTSKSDTGTSEVVNEKETDDTTTNQSPVKRRKRKSRSESNVEESTPALEPSSNVNDKEDEVTVNVEVVDEESPPTEDEDEENCDSSVEIIDIPPELINISSSEEDNEKDDHEQEQEADSTDEEMPFDREELESLETNLELSNVQNDTQNSWDVQHDPEQSINYDDMQSEDIVVSIDDNLETSNEEDLAVHQSWCTPGFDLEGALASMSSEQRNWKIMERDRIHVKLSQRGIRCKRCREFGHLTIDCLRQIIRCWLCGEVGHQEPRCPHKICTSCGRKCNFFTNNCGYCRRFAHRKCNICGIRGHTHEMCPDLWRRYHLTTEPGEIIGSTLGPKMLKSRSNRWCSGCGKQGHFEDSCNYYNRQLSRVSNYIHKYIDVYKMSRNLKLKPKSDKLTVKPTPAPPEQRVEEETEEVHDLSTESGNVEVEIVDEEAVEEVEQEEEAVEVEDEAEKGEETQKEVEEEEAVEEVQNLVEHDENEVQHQKLETSFHMCRVATEMLRTAKGNEFLKSLCDHLDMKFTFESVGITNLITLCGYPTDLIEVSKVVKQFISNPLMTEKKLSLSSKNWKNVKANYDILVQLSKNFKVAVTWCAEKRQISLFGSVFDILLAAHSLINSISAETELPGKDSICFKPSIIEYIRGHPRMKELEEHYSIKWSIKKRQVVLVGATIDIKCMKQEINNFVKKDTRRPTFLLWRVNEIIKHTDNPQVITAEFVENSLKAEDVTPLNAIVLREEPFFQQLKQLRDKLESRQNVDKKLSQEADFLITEFTRKRNKKFYMNYLSKIEEERKTKEEERKKSDESLTYCMDLSPAQMSHVLNTPEGIDFLKELNADFRVEVMEDLSKLFLYCNVGQKDAVVDKIDLYFLIYDIQLPVKPIELHRKLAKWLAYAKLDYYTTTCGILFGSIDNEKKNSMQFKQLHGLFFAKHKLLDGHKHLDTIMHYMEILPRKKNSTLSLAEYRRIKMAALYLFCPVAMDIPYAKLIPLTVPPQVPRIPPEEYDSTLAEVKNCIEFGLAKLSKECAETKIVELEVINWYLKRHEYSKGSLEIAKAFLLENELDFGQLKI